MRIPGPLVVLTLVAATGCSSAGPVSQAPREAPASPASPVSAAAAPVACEFEPDETNTGPQGDLDARGGEDVVLDDGESLVGARVRDVTIAGDDVVVRDVEATGSILVTGDGATVERVATTAISVSSASGATIRYADVSGGAQDGVHITSDRGRMVRDVVLSHNFVHSPDLPDDAHYDGTQVRGVNGLTIECSTYDPGPYLPMLNANVFLEDANGGARRVSVRHNWLVGSGFSVMVDGEEIELVENRVTAPHWGTCYLGGPAGTESVTNRGNVDDRTGDPEPMCAEPAAVG